MVMSYTEKDRIQGTHLEYVLTLRCETLVFVGAKKQKMLKRTGSF